MLLFRQKHTGFTIVELLIVIVVIAILAAISVVAYSGIQERARNAKISADLTQLEKAIHAARVNTGRVLMQITGSGCSGCACRSKPISPDIAVLDKATDSCWTRYATTMQNISNDSGINVTDLVDPLGRPYYIDENEGEQTGTYGPCGIGRDGIGTIQAGSSSWSTANGRSIPYITAGC